jgi:glycogen synthase
MLAMADVFVLPSVSEPFGITPLEAMKYNTSIIISKQSGVAEILDHVFKVDFWDIDQMSSMVITILKDKVLKEETIKKNKIALDGIDWMNSAKKVHWIYVKSLEGSL